LTCPCWPHLTCPQLSPSPHANSFVIGTAVIDTHNFQWGILLSSQATRSASARALANMPSLAFIYLRATAWNPGMENRS
jgi:hypothetical protein